MVFARYFSERLNILKISNALIVYLFEYCKCGKIVLANSHRVEIEDT